MKRYQAATPRAAMMVAAVALSALTLGLSVLPAIWGLATGRAGSPGRRKAADGRQRSRQRRCDHGMACGQKTAFEPVATPADAQGSRLTAAYSPAAARATPGARLPKGRTSCVRPCAFAAGRRQLRDCPAGRSCLRVLPQICQSLIWSRSRYLLPRPD
jgi:hypothetical protein